MSVCLRHSEEEEEEEEEEEGWMDGWMDEGKVVVQGKG